MGNFHGVLENRKKRENLARRIFPRLRYCMGKPELVTVTIY